MLSRLSFPHLMMTLLVLLIAVSSPAVAQDEKPFVFRNGVPGMSFAEKEYLAKEIGYSAGRVTENERKSDSSRDFSVTKDSIKAVDRADTDTILGENSPVANTILQPIEKFRKISRDAGTISEASNGAGIDHATPKGDPVFRKTLAANQLRLNDYIDLGNGLQAVLLTDLTTFRKYIVVRGTEGSGRSITATLRDVDTDFNTTSKNFHAVGKSQYNSGALKFSEWARKYSGNIEVIGHSLGGAIAQRIILDNAKHIVSATLFNTPGLEAEELERIANDPRLVRNLLTPDGKRKVKIANARDDIVGQAGKGFILADVFIAHGGTVDKDTHNGYISGKGVVLNPVNYFSYQLIRGAMGENFGGLPLQMLGDLSNAIQTYVYGGEKITDIMERIKNIEKAVNDLIAKNKPKDESEKDILKSVLANISKIQAEIRRKKINKKDKAGETKVKPDAKTKPDVKITAGSTSDPSASFVTVGKCGRMAIDPARDEILAKKGPTRIAKGTFHKERPEDGFERREITFKFQWALADGATPMIGQALYRYVDNDPGYLLPSTDFKGSEALIKGRFSGGHGGKFEGLLVDNEDKDDVNRVTGYLCADGTGEITRQTSDGPESWKVKFEPFPLGSVSVLQGYVSFPTKAKDAGSNPWGKQIISAGNIGLGIEGALVSGNITLLTNTRIPFQNIVLSGDLQGVHFIDGRILLHGKLPWQAEDMDRCKRMASNADGCVGKGSVFIRAKRVGDRFEGRWAALGISGNWSAPADVLVLEPDEIEPFTRAANNRMAELKSAGLRPDLAAAEN